ncbi:MAG: GntR family transcriptional regulator [Nocardioidaceae bacterium]
MNSGGVPPTAVEGFEGFERRLTPAVKVRSVDDVVSQIRAILLSGDLPPSQKLPSERELGRILDVSRNTVREALRILEANGLVEIRVGGSGGAFTRGPDAGTVGSALSMLLTFEAATERDLNEFRFSFEQENAALAAVRATSEQREQLRSLARQAARGPAGEIDWQTVRGVDLALHELLPLLTQNTVRVAVSKGIHEALARTVTRVEPQSTPRALWEDILGIVEVVVAGDSQGARAAMAAHLRVWRPGESAAAEAVAADH